MELQLLLKGMVIGFSIAAPVGPIGVLCIRRTLSEGRAVGLMSGMGAATADAAYGAVAAFGLTAISTFAVGQQLWFRLVGGLILVGLGMTSFAYRPALSTPVATAGGLARAYASTFALTISNPVTVLAFAAVFGGLGITAGRDRASAALLVLGVFAGSAVWWVMLSSGVSASRRWFSKSAMHWINRAAGLVIAGSGLLVLSGLGR